MTQMHL